jgi:O-antigen/teichoic acid export membrane protein
VVPILLLANLFLGIYYNLSIWFKLTDKTYYGTLISVSGAGLTIILNYVLIPVWGYTGSSIATLACYFSMVVFSYFLGKKHYPVPYKTGKYLFYIVLAVLFSYLGFNMPEDYTIKFKLFQLTLILLYMAIIAILERKQFRPFFKKE